LVAVPAVIARCFRCYFAAVIATNRGIPRLSPDGLLFFPWKNSENSGGSWLRRF